MVWFHPVSRWPYFDSQKRDNWRCDQRFRRRTTGGSQRRWSYVGMGSARVHPSLTAGFRGRRPKFFFEILHAIWHVVVDLLDHWWVAFNECFFKMRKSGQKQDEARKLDKMASRWCQKVSGTHTAKRGLCRKKTGTDGHLTLYVPAGRDS